MKTLVFVSALFFAVLGIIISCKKDISCEGCPVDSTQSEVNKPPVANAGADQVIILATDSIFLDGSTSNDPDGTIVEWNWTKISGPAAFAIKNESIAKTIVKNLSEGTYGFELKVTDDRGSSSKDTMHVSVYAAVTCDSDRPLINAKLTPLGKLSLARA